MKPPITVWLNASGHSVNGASGSKDIAYQEAGDDGHVFDLNFQGSVCSLEKGRGWIDLEEGNIEFYSCMGTSVLSLPNNLLDRVRSELV